MKRARQEKLNAAIIVEKHKLDQMVKSPQDLRKREAIEQSCKLDQLVVLAMRQQLEEKREKA
ncbi:MAG: hypothetical protein SCK28_03965 [Bacillota bacterium]|nr:hypothetical protein [Bacillota bacterium]